MQSIPPITTTLWTKSYCQYLDSISYLSQSFSQCYYVIVCKNLKTFIVKRLKEIIQI